MATPQQLSPAQCDVAPITWPDLAIPHQPDRVLRITMQPTGADNGLPAGAIPSTCGQWMAVVEIADPADEPDRA